MTIDEAARQILRGLVKARGGEAVAVMMGTKAQNLAGLMAGRGRYIGLRHLEGLARGMNMSPGALLRRLAAMVEGKIDTDQPAAAKGAGGLLMDAGTAAELAAPSSRGRKRAAKAEPQAPRSVGVPAAPQR